MPVLRISDVRVGMVIQLREGQSLFDVSKSPWRTLGPGCRLTVRSIEPLATSTERRPMDLVLIADDGATVRLETEDDNIELFVVKENEETSPDSVQ